MNDNDSENPNEEDKIIVCYDEDGNERLISTKDWREQVLPDQLKANFDNPDNQLYFPELQTKLQHHQ